ncbi:hypothetical protein [Variovorax sp. VNK109]|uniref:hypothetical protein n=1 Tax=Variovorax sp. VNK109 TaxID=3400919 RepID=UPI003C304002
MYLVVIAWMYVVLMMSVAEATNTTGTILGAIVTFVLYGVLPMSIVVYILGTPGRKRKIKAREEEEARAAAAQRAAQHATQSASVSASVAPDESREAPADAIAPVGKET